MTEIKLNIPDACPQGHTGRWYKNTKGSRYCRQCKAERRRAKSRTPCRHEGACEPLTDSTGRVQCRVKLRNQALKMRSKLYDIPPRKPETNPDGWEDEFGPVPPIIPDTAWVDRVALMRRLKNEPVGRELTVGEFRALHLLEVMRESA